MRQDLPAEAATKGVVVAWYWIVESLSRLLEYIGRFWLSERVGWTWSRHWLVVLLRRREFDTRVVEGEHAMEHGLRKQNNKWWRLFSFFLFVPRLFPQAIWKNNKSDSWYCGVWAYNTWGFRVRESTNVAYFVAQNFLLNLWTQIIFPLKLRLIM